MVRSLRVDFDGYPKNVWLGPWGAVLNLLGKILLVCVLIGYSLRVPGPGRVGITGDRV